MANAKNIALYVTITLWGTLIGAVMYAHVAFFSTYLHHLPASNSLISGPYGIHDEIFWKSIHPVLIGSLLISLLLNRKFPARRKLILIPLCIYIAILIITFMYFVPELKEFAKSGQSDIQATEWLQRGKRWEQLSWIRGSFLYAGFIFLLKALVCNRFPK